MTHGGKRDNQATFMEGCKALHSFFREFPARRKDLSEAQFLEFKDIHAHVGTIIGHQSPKQGRIDAWKNAASDGHLFRTGSESIPDYDLNAWHNQRDNLTRSKDSETAINEGLYKFYQAASVYRNYILRILLPSKGLVVT